KWPMLPRRSASEFTSAERGFALGSLTDRRGGGQVGPTNRIKRARAGRKRGHEGSRVCVACSGGVRDLEGWRRQLLDVATAHEQQATVTSETYQNAVATCKLSQAANGVVGIGSPSHEASLAFVAGPPVAAGGGGAENRPWNLSDERTWVHKHSDAVLETRQPAGKRRPGLGIRKTIAGYVDEVA